MNLGLNEAQRLLRETLVRVLRAESTPARVRAAEPSGFDRALWTTLCRLGVPMMRASEPAGGDAALLDAAIVAEETGRYLTSAPVIESMVATRLLGELGGEDTKRWLVRVAGDGAVVTMALHPIESDRSQLVPAGAIADAVIGLDGDAVVLFTGLPVDSPSNLGAFPLARHAMGGSGHQANRIVLASGPRARALFLAAIEEWKLLTAAALAGLSRQAIDMAAAYATERRQFGRAIGSFQGIAHPLAESVTEIEAAQLLIWRAVWAIASGRDDAAASISMAYWWACDAADRAVQRALRTFGGYGLSLEYDIQLWFRRGKALALLFGDPQAELQRVGDRLWCGATPPLPEAGITEIDFGYGAAADKFAAETRRFFDANLTESLRAKTHHSTDGHDDGFHRAQAKAGLLYPDWPRRWGGDERSAYEVSAMALVYEDIGWTRIPAGITNMVARIVMGFGCEALNHEVLPRFADGTALACLGFSEPESGSDIFAAKTRAVREGDEWVISGQKMFTTAAHIADYAMLLTRTSSNGPKHQGLTLFLIPMSSPGVAIQAIHTLQDERTNITFYDNVRIPDRYRLGEVNRGMEVMAAAMAIEHGGESYHLPQLGLLKAAVAWARTPRDGTAPIESADVRKRLARVAVHTEAADLLCRRAVWAGVEGIPSRAWGPMSKMLSTETYMRDSAELMALTAPDSVLIGNGVLAQIELRHRQSIAVTIYGGTSEVHKSIIAEQALGLPRSRF